MSTETIRLRGNALIMMAALVIIFAGLKSAQDLVVPFLLSVFIATIAATPMIWLQRRGVPEGFSLPLTIILMVFAIVLMGALVAQSASAFSAKLPFYQDKLEALRATLQGDLTATVLPLLQPLGVESLDLNQVFKNFSPNSALELAGNTLTRLGGVLSNSFLIVLTVIFILAEAASFPRKLSEILSDPEEHLPYFSRFAENVNRYIAIKTSVSVATGVVASTFLWILGVDFPVLWGLLAFMLNYVPTIGSIIAAVPPLLLALIQLGPGSALAVAGGYVVINVFMGNVVEPRYMGRELGLSTLVVFLSLVVWGWVMGPVGMLLSVPLTMTAKIALEANPDTHWLAVLLGPAIDDNEDAEDEASSASSEAQAEAEGVANPEPPNAQG